MHALRIWWMKLCVRVPIVDRGIAAPVRKLRVLRKNYMLRHPHRSFRRTLRRDYRRSLKLPGYWAFTWYVGSSLYKWRRQFFGLAVIYAVLSGFLVGIGSQDSFNQLVDTFKSTNLFDSGWGNIGQASLLFITTVGQGISNPSPTGGQSAFGFLLVLMLWLTAVWLLRVNIAGKLPRLRDGLYNAGAPIIAMIVVSFFGLIQILPMALGIFVSTAIFSIGGVLSMLLSMLSSLLIALSLYWLTSTFFAMIVVTLPGMYPWQAMRTASDLVMGRRVRILLRMLWAIFGVIIAWAIVMIPLILFDVWLGSVWSWVQIIPIVPVALLVMSTLSLIWLSTYVYLLYRRVVDDDAAPA